MSYSCSKVCLPADKYSQFDCMLQLKLLLCLKHFELIQVGSAKPSSSHVYSDTSPLSSNFNRVSLFCSMVSFLKTCLPV